MSVIATLTKFYKPPEKLTVSEWADKYRFLSPEASAEAGKWKTSRVEFQRGILDTISDSKISEVVIMSSAQIGKTEIINNTLAYYITQDPAPILLMQPTLEMAQAFSKDRLAPMIRDTPKLDEIFKNKAKDSENTVLHKTFGGGNLSIVGANSPSSLASRPKRIILADEVDRFPASAGEEGDPVELAEKRATTFWNKKFIKVSTPTIKGISSIEKNFNLSDQRKYYIPCPHCQTFFVMDNFNNFKWDKGKPETALYLCPNCGEGITNNQKNLAVKNGRWEATASFNGVAGFWINELYSPFSNFTDIAKNYERAETKGIQSVKVWWNTSWGVPFEMSKGVSSDGLIDRKEEYKAEVPMGAMVLTAGVDVQDDRLELEIVGWGEIGESWSIAYKIIHGDPKFPKVWRELDNILNSEFLHESGINLKIKSTAIDIGGHRTKYVLKYCKDKFYNGVYAIKGSSERNKPIISQRAKKSKDKQTNIFLVGTDTAKFGFYTALEIDKIGAEYCHFPDLEIYDEEYFAQLTAEKFDIEKNSWVKIRQRNEALDCRIYAIAGLEIFESSQKINWKKLKERFQHSSKKDKKNDEIDEVIEIKKIEDKPKPTKKKKRGWLRGY